VRARSRREESASPKAAASGYGANPSTEIFMKIDASLMPPDIASAGPMAASIERQGYDAAWTFEGPHDPFFPLVTAADATQSVKLGTSIAIAFARNPMICAGIGWDMQAHSRNRALGVYLSEHYLPAVLKTQREMTIRHGTWTARARSAETKLVSDSPDSA
jgi:hypothetical protein